MREDPIILTHNLDPRKFVFLWMKYVIGPNDKHHCTNSIRGRYSRKLSKHNENLLHDNALILDEQPAASYKALYICGVSANGYRQKRNYPHNLHAPILPKEGVEDEYVFENWRLHVQNGIFLPIPTEDEIPPKYRSLPAEFTTCRIFRWAVCFFQPSFSTQEIEVIHP